jgi:TrmH family RNA methyltransferase
VTGPPRITSRQHPLVRRCRELARQRSDAEVLLDGEHLVDAALDCGVAIKAVLVTDGSTPLAARARSSGAEVTEVPATVLDAASPVRQPSGVLAIASWTPATLEAALSGVTAPVLALVGVQDPGNLGSAIRAADALGAAAVLALDGSADPGGWKALRGAMGSTFRLPVARGTTDAALAIARRQGLTIAATTPSGGLDLRASPLPPTTLLLLGNEGAGLPSGLLSMAQKTVSVPMRSGVESLNVAVTAALLLDALRATASPLSRRGTT